MSESSNCFRSAGGVEKLILSTLTITVTSPLFGNGWELFNIVITIWCDGNTMLLNSRLLAFTAVISAVTVVLSALTVPFLFGTGIHFFQAGIMLGGVVGGPLSGMITGMIGGVYVAMIRSDPTIVIGNGLLGLCTGIFSRKLRPVLAGLAA